MDSANHVVAGATFSRQKDFDGKLNTVKKNLKVPKFDN